jgi:uncharacterized protein
VDEHEVIVVGAGLAGLVATAELAGAGRRVLLLDQEPEASLGGQAFWSLGGLFLVDTPEQRHWGVRDSLELAWQDWEGTAAFDRPEDLWPERWARAYVEFAAAEKRDWLHSEGVRWLPNPGWAERGGYGAIGHGNSVPRFHLTWGTGPGVLAPFLRRLADARARGIVTFRPRHRVDELIMTGDGSVVGVRGAILEPSAAARGQASSRVEVGEFSLEGRAVLLSSGGIGGDLDAVRAAWPPRLGSPPRRLISGVPAHVDGRGIAVAERAGGRVIGRDRMWHYVEGIHNWSPIWPHHGIRILPAPSSLWLDATGRRLPVPLFPGFDTLGTLGHIARSGHDHTWFVLTRRIIEREFALSGSEQNPDITGKSIRAVLRERLGGGIPAPIEAFMRQGQDFAVAPELPALVQKMNAITDGHPELDPQQVEREVVARDREMANPFTKDLQVMAMRSSRRYLADRLSRVAAPHRLLDPAAGPLIAVRLSILTRKTLGGLETDLSGRVLREGGDPLPGLWAAGEAAGFGGGGMHGYRSLEGTFLGGCLFSGRVAGRSLVAAIA